MPYGGHYYLYTTFGSTSPLIIGKAKNVQNLAWFRTTFDFDRKYLWNRLGYRQAVNGVINYHFFCVEQRNLMNFGLLTTKLCLLISIYPTSTVCRFSDNFRLWLHISWEWIEISRKGKQRLQLRSIPRWTQTNSWTWVHKQQSSVVLFRTTQV